MSKQLKNDIKFALQLNSEQKEAKDAILKNVITILNGKAGSGKTTVAAQVALDLLFRKEVEKVVITRALITDEEVGILPGGIDEKLAPFTAPIYDNMYRLYNREKIDSLIKDGEIEVIPIAFLRGRNFSNAIVICDEAQNLTNKQAEKILTRICHGSKVILCGDIDQCDLKRTNDSALHFLNKHIDKLDNCASLNLVTNHRHEVVEQILKLYKNGNGEKER